MCQDEWWLYHNISQCLCSEDTGTDDWDARSWGAGLGHGVTFVLPHRSPCTCLGSAGAHTRMLWGGHSVTATPPPSHTHSHDCYTWLEVTWFPAHLGREIQEEVMQHVVWINWELSEVNSLLKSGKSCPLSLQFGQLLKCLLCSSRQTLQ